MVTKAAMCWILSEGLSGTRGGCGNTAMTNEKAVAAQNSARRTRGLCSARIMRSVRVMGSRLVPHFLGRHPRSELYQSERTAMSGALEHGEVGDDHVDHVPPGQRQRALRNELG